MHTPIATSRATRLRRQAVFALAKGELYEAERYANEAVELSRDYDDHAGVVGALVLHAKIARRHGDRTQARLWVREAMRWHRLHIVGRRPAPL